jgi:hypothetical protein
MTEHSITESAFAAALAASHQEAEVEIRARAVRYVADHDAVEILTTRDAGFLIPREWIDALRDVSIQDLAKLAIWPDGSAIEIEDRDIHISVDGLMAAVLPAMLPARAVAALFKATSAAKRASVKESGRRGGRSRKASIGD